MSAADSAPAAPTFPPSSGSAPNVEAQADRFDLLVIGGGVNGAGIARDAAGRGLRVCLVEQSDLAAHTSSASTKLIHGGLRYLEYREFRLVRESLAERERLLHIAPHLVHPLRFILPYVPTLRPRWEIRAGLFLYDHLGGHRHLPGSRSVDLRREAVGAPLKSVYRRGFAYSDCSVDDSRLVVVNARDAADRGAVILTRTRVSRARPEPGGWQVECESSASGTIRMRASALVNASGAWINEVRARLGLRSPEPVRLVRGSHIVVARLFEGEHAYILQNPDHRIVFAIPFQERFTLIGTTDVPHTAPLDRVAITSEETAYLCESVNRYFEKTIRPEDVLWSYSGVRSLRDDGASEASQVTRDYELVLEHVAVSSPVLTVLGGKITTYRKLAESALALLQPSIGGSAARWTATASLPGGDLPGASLAEFLAEAARRWPFLAHEHLRRLACAYGTRMERVLQGARTAADLGEHLGADLTAVEVDYLKSEEWAVTGEDILWRRTKLGLRVTPTEVERLDRYLGEAHPVSVRRSIS
jgi:glycerol-3-phosphate dehydrogenase